MPKEEVLMLVKTYPHPSRSYGELVCTAGIRTRDAEWVRIYPYPFRFLQDERRFQKWQLVMTLNLEKTPRHKDPRVESHRLLETHTIEQGSMLEVGNDHWESRMTWIRRTAAPNVASLLDGIPDKGESSWGATIRPVAIRAGARLEAEFVGTDWNAEQLERMALGRKNLESGLFNDPELVDQFQSLQRVPFDFFLRFQDLTGTEYKFQILDWEICRLALRMQQDHGIEAVVDKVRQKVEGTLCSDSRETFLILGNIHHRFKKKLLAVDGFVYPKRLPQNSLF
jgi:hypothetical protein